VVPFGSKALFGLAAAAMVASISYGVSTSDGSATAVLGFVAVGAFLLGVVVIFAGPDREPWAVADVPRTEQAPMGARPALPSPWPLAGGIALAVLALGAATDGVVVVTAAVLLVVVGFGWLFQAWTEHPTYTARYGKRLKERILVPIGLPVAVVLLVAVIVISLSRVLLAVPETASRAVALAVALVILFSAFAVASSQRMARTAMFLLCALALVAVVGAGAAGLSHGERKFEKNVPHTPVAPAPGQHPVGGSTATTAGTGPTTTAASGAKP